MDSLKKEVIIKFIAAFIVIAAFLFIPAGTLKWAEAWIYLMMQFLFSGFVAYWLKKHDPELLKRRLSKRMPERGWDKFFMAIACVICIALFILFGLDAVRFRWSNIPFYIEALGFVGVILAFYIIFSTMRENTYLSPIVEIQKKRNHKVITTGPYKYVRHPMYVGMTILFFSLSLALGSFYSFIPSLFIAAFIVYRAYNEDRALHKELKGYKEYAMKTKYRLLPGIW